MPQDFDPTRTSKFLSLILRHKPETVGLTLGEGGWLNVDELLTALARNGHPLTREQLDGVVANNEKRRFGYDATGLRIRAVQGHSQNVDLGYKPAVPPAILYHGTVGRFLSSILQRGLVRGSRRHVHLSQDVATARVVGKRRGKPVTLEIASGAMHQEGHSFFRADNGVWLTDHVPAEFVGHLSNEPNAD